MSLLSSVWWSAVPLYDWETYHYEYILYPSISLFLDTWRRFSLCLEALPPGGEWTLILPISFFPSMCFFSHLWKIKLFGLCRPLTLLLPLLKMPGFTVTLNHSVLLELLSSSRDWGCDFPKAQVYLVQHSDPGSSHPYFQSHVQRLGIYLFLSSINNQSCQIV